MVWFGKGNFRTLSLDFPVLSKEERLFERPCSGGGCQLRPGSGQALALARAATHCVLASVRSRARVWDVLQQPRPGKQPLKVNGPRDSLGEGDSRAPCRTAHW